MFLAAHRGNRTRSLRPNGRTWPKPTSALQSSRKTIGMRASHTIRSRKFWITRGTDQFESRTSKVDFVATWPFVVEAFHDRVKLGAGKDHHARDPDPGHEAYYCAK